MANQSGTQLFEQSMNGLISIDNADTISVFELDAENTNTDNLIVNNSITGTHIITQSGIGFNTLKNTLFNGNIGQIVGSTISQTIGTTTYNALNKTNLTGDFNVNNGNININNGNLTITNGNLVSSIQQIGNITNNMRNTNFVGNVDISGNLTLSGSLTYDILDIDAENLIVRQDASMNNVDISGNLIVKDVLHTYNSEYKNSIAYNFVQTTETTGIVVLSFSVIANVSANLTIGYISPLSVKENGLRALVDETTTTTINSCVANLYKDAVLYDTNSASSSNGYGVVQSFTIGADPIPPANAFNYQKYIMTLSGFFTINHISSPSITNYTIELVINSTRTNALAPSTYNLILNTTQSGYTQSAVIAYSPAVVADYQATNYSSAISFPSFPSSTDMGTIVCNEIINNNLYNYGEIITDSISVNNVLDTYTTDNIYNINQNLENSGFGILTFSVKPNISGTFVISFVCPLSIKENGIRPTTGNQTSITTFNSCVADLYKNSVSTGSSVSMSSSNGYGIAQTFVIQGGAVGVIPYNYQKYITTLTGSFTYNHTSSTSITNYAVRITLSRSDTSPVCQIQKIVMINTTFSSFIQSGLFSSSPTFINNFQAVDNFTNLNVYNDYTGVLVNNKLVNNNIYNSENITTQGLIQTIAPIVTSGVVSLPESTLSNVYLLAKSGGTTVTLTNASENYKGAIFYIRKISPTTLANNTTFTVETGASFVVNVTTYTTSQTSTGVYFILLYGGSGVWYFLNF